MRKLLGALSVVVLLGGCSNGFGLLSQSPTGNWKVTGRSLTFTLTQFGTDWNVTTPTDQGYTASGTFDGTNLDVTYKFTAGSTTSTEIKGKYAAGAISGTMTDTTAVNSEDYPFTAQHQ